MNNSAVKPSAFFNMEKLLPKNGITQVDTRAPAMDIVAIHPLVERIESERIMHRWYADDGIVAGKWGNYARALTA